MCCFGRAKCCECCECCNNILKQCDIPCCNRYFPEWRVGATWWIFLVRSIFVIIFSALMIIFYYLWSEPIFNTTRITFGSTFVLSLFMTNSIFLVLLYGPYLIRTYPWWTWTIIFLLYIGGALFLVIQQLYLGKYAQLNDDLEWFGIWTIIHFLAGPFFGLVLPFIWMFIIVTGWEILEILTSGFGEGESIANRSVDIGAAVVGWWLLILIFKHTRTDIPWISTMNAAGNNGKEIQWEKIIDKICKRKEEESYQNVSVTENPSDTDSEAII